MRIWIILLKFKTISVWSQHNFWDFKFVFDSINTQRVNYNNIAICLLFSSCNHDGLLAQQYTQTFNSHHPVYPWVATMCHTMTQPQQPLHRLVLLTPKRTNLYYEMFIAKSVVTERDHFCDSSFAATASVSLDHRHRYSSVTRLIANNFIKGSLIIHSPFLLRPASASLVQQIFFRITDN